MGGTSGAIYSLFFTGITKYIKTLSKTTFNWSHAINNGLGSIMKYSKAREGDRTMVSLILYSRPVKNIAYKKVFLHSSIILRKIICLFNNPSPQIHMTKLMKISRSTYVNLPKNAWGRIIIFTVLLLTNICIVVLSTSSTIVFD